MLTFIFLIKIKEDVQSHLKNQHVAITLIDRVHVI